MALKTPYYAFEHDLARGGAISSVHLAHGKAQSLLSAPVETIVRAEDGRAFSETSDPNPRIELASEGSRAVLTVECSLLDRAGADSGVRARTTYDYRWGYLRARKELRFPAGFRAREICGFAAILAPSLSHYGYREGKTEAEGAPAFSFGSCLWGKVPPEASGPALSSPYVPRYVGFLDPGVEGIEWFVGSDLSQWECAVPARRGRGLFEIGRSGEPAGIAVRVCPLHLEDGALPLEGLYVFEYRLGVPILPGRAFAPWFHTAFNRNRGDWVSAETIRAWAASGIRTVHCHNDGDYYGDGLFWRDGSYPPYPPEDMAKYDRVIEDCHAAGIRVATYFSNKELHPSTPEFEKHGSEWGRKDAAGRLQHNFYREGSEFGAQMCLRSGWLEFFQESVDRVLSKHRLDGVYYDWNVALLCANPLHEGRDAAKARAGGGESSGALGHWDMDELLDLMEWTRGRVGPDGLIIVHNTTVPMFATENFANYVVATEWGYRSWAEGAPDLEELPLEWSFVGARPRGVISYGLIPAGAPRRLHRVFALEALLGGSAPWPPGPEAFEIFRILKPIGDLTAYRFLDWRRSGLSVERGRLAAAAYVRPGEAFFAIANLEDVPRRARIRLRPGDLLGAFGKVRSAAIVASTGSAEFSELQLPVADLESEGAYVELPPDGAILLRVRGD